MPRLFHRVGRGMILSAVILAFAIGVNFAEASAAETRAAEPSVSSEVSFYTGVTVTAPTSIEIKQQGFPKTTITNVRFANKPFVAPPYWGLRYRREWETSGGPIERLGFEAELVHYKIYYESGDDTAGIIQRFDVTDGLNLVYINAVGIKALQDDLAVSARVGLGPVIAHPETEIRHQKRGQDGDWSGFEYAGLTWQGGVALEKSLAWPQSLARGSRAFVEYKYTAADPTIRIAGGTASTSVRAHHFVAGWSVVF